MRENQQTDKFTTCKTEKVVFKIHVTKPNLILFMFAELTMVDFATPASFNK